MVEMKNMKTSKELCSKIVEVNRLENVGDDLYRKTMTSLFTSGMDTLEVIKWKEIYEFLEKLAGRVRGCRQHRRRGRNEACLVLC